MCKFLSLSALILLLSYGVLPAQSTICWLDPSEDFHERSPLIMKADSTELLHPKKGGSKPLSITFLDNLLAVCPGGTITVFGTDTKLSEAKISCYGITLFGLGGTSYAAPFRQIRCNKIPEAEVQKTTTPCRDGTISKIGFPISTGSFIPTIEEICLDSEKTFWTHHKVVPGLNRVSSGGLWGGDNDWTSWWRSNKKSSRKINTYAGTDEIINTPLVPREDMLYRAEQESTYNTINSVPMYKSIKNGNWRMVEDIVRKVAGTRNQPAILDVWTGRYDVASTTTTTEVPSTTTVAATTASAATTVASTTASAATTVASTTASAATTAATTVTTTVAATTVEAAATTTVAPNTGSRNSRQLQPTTETTPEFVFKMVVDKQRNRGIVFVTLNDPTATAITANQQLCATSYDKCTQLYPQFNVVSQGYTQCCTLAEFASVAEELGLPSFTNVQTLF